jgi:hypothetical protein
MEESLSMPPAETLSADVPLQLSQVGLELEKQETRAASTPQQPADSIDVVFGIDASLERRTSSGCVETANLLDL